MSRLFVSPLAGHHRRVKWSRAADGLVCLNVDGRLLCSNNTAGYGGLLRNRDGGFIWGFYGAATIQNILYAKIMAIWYGLKLCWEPGFRKRKQEKAGKDDLFRPIPDGEFELVPLGEDPTKGVKIGADLPDLVKRQLKACLRENAELFAWSAAEMPGIDPEVACHQLTIDPRVSAVVQRRRKQSPEKAEAARKAVKDLLEANFIAEAQYTIWLSNVVLVKKSNGKWRMCVDYTDLNRAYPKDAYPLPNIDKLVDNSSGFKLLSFMDAYSGYNQIKMAEIDKKKTAFMTETGNYYYNVMPFGLKNAGATYQRMMNRVFHNEIGDMLEVYMDDMIVKSEEEIDHTVHLKRVFDQARKFNMRFNPEKCTFGVKAGKFLGFYLTERGIEANPGKCRAFFDYPTPKSKKSIQTLNGMLTSMARFVAKSAQHALPLFKLLRKETAFEWTEECEGALQHLKRALSEPPVLTRPVEGEKLYLYLVVASEAISAVLIRETEQGQKPVYFVSRALQGPELRYLQIEKIALAVIMAARKLRYYFLAHSIIIRTDQPVKQLLARPDMVGRMLKWSLELAEFDISFESRKALKAQVLADFVAEMTTSTTSEKNKWTIFVDGSSNSQGSGAGIILEKEDGVLIEVSLGLSFPTTNNQAEYEAFLAGLRLAEDMGAEEIRIFTDSAKLAKFKETEVKHVPREHNARADVLSKLASTRRKKAGNQSLIQETLSKPSIEKQQKSCTFVLSTNKAGCPRLTSMLDGEILHASPTVAQYKPGRAPSSRWDAQCCEEQFQTKEFSSTLVWEPAKHSGSSPNCSGTVLMIRDIKKQP
ncbi:hypothetical protein TSUD_201330 [Trifolium subterraneum]|uniref:RNase H type-1 domain-containing protein n=1 Tax=Trifolium subterraneum TaxID=3900 RepID=A0A2Z6LQ80_TRISU|nr:hypothetical protein TSUD_201330 [Trifolium subterraneum]